MDTSNFQNFFTQSYQLKNNDIIKLKKTLDFSPPEVEMTKVYPQETTETLFTSFPTPVETPDFSPPEVEMTKVYPQETAETLFTSFPTPPETIESIEMKGLYKRLKSKGKMTQKKMLNFPETVIIKSDQLESLVAESEFPESEFPESLVSESEFPESEFPESLVAESEFPESVEMIQTSKPMEISPEEIEIGFSQKPITFISKRNLSQLNLNINTAVIKSQIGRDKSKYNNTKFSIRQKPKE